MPRLARARSPWCAGGRLAATSPCTSAVARRGPGPASLPIASAYDRRPTPPPRLTSQGSFYSLTYEWLRRHGYPPGPVIVTRSAVAALPGRGRLGKYAPALEPVSACRSESVVPNLALSAPSGSAEPASGTPATPEWPRGAPRLSCARDRYAFVKAFKLDYMAQLRALGVKLHAAYGNTTTDIEAYLEAEIAADQIFIVGGGRRLISRSLNPDPTGSNCSSSELPCALGRTAASRGRSP
jgi:hypothetical protein